MSMVEKCGLAMMLACHAQDPLVGPYELPEERWAWDAAFRHYWLALARAALEALRVPSDEMVDAGVDEWVKPGRGMWHAMHASFAAMLTAALGETE